MVLMQLPVIKSPKMLKKLTMYKPKIGQDLPRITPEMVVRKKRVKPISVPEPALDMQTKNIIEFNLNDRQEKINRMGIPLRDVLRLHFNKV